MAWRPATTATPALARGYPGFAAVSDRGGRGASSGAPTGSAVREAPRG
jgi:hypothetical protein